MTDRKLEREEWKTYFDFMSRSLLGRRVEMEVAGLDLGDQIETDWAVLDGLSYDPHDDVLYVHTVEIRHRIGQPQEIYVTESGPAISAIGVKDGSGNLQVVTLREPFMLEAAVIANRSDASASANNPEMR